MGALTSTGPISIEEYLTNPAYRYYEYVEGQPIRLHVGTKDHSRIQVKCSRKLDEYFDSHPGGYVVAELHCRLKVHSEVRFRLPDIAVVLGFDTSPDSRYLDCAPDLVLRSVRATTRSRRNSASSTNTSKTEPKWLG
jgi:Uma2 family endonuclease